VKDFKRISGKISKDIRAASDWQSRIYH